LNTTTVESRYVIVRVKLCTYLLIKRTYLFNVHERLRTNCKNFQIFRHLGKLFGEIYKVNMNFSILILEYILGTYVFVLVSSTRLPILHTYILFILWKLIDILLTKKLYMNAKWNDVHHLEIFGPRYK
jgi:hypothetical protein